jgi:hypothetical protein
MFYIFPECFQIRVIAQKSSLILIYPYAIAAGFAFDALVGLFFIRHITLHFCYPPPPALLSVRCFAGQ